MGHIIYWALLRFTVVLLGSWALYDYIDDPGQWWTMFFLSVSVLVIYPAQLSLKRHDDEVKRTSQASLCSTCKYYIADNTLCAVLDEHVTINRTPCEGVSWEPIPVKEYME